MDYLHFWNTQKREFKTFNDTQGKITVSEIAIWSGRATRELRACIIRKNVYKILDIRDTEIKELKCHGIRIPKIPGNILTTAVHWNPFHEEQIAIGLADSHVIHWNINTDKFYRYHQASSYVNTTSRSMTCLQWCPSNPSVLIYGTKDPFIKLWDVRTPEPTAKFPNNEGVLDMKFDPFDENQFACANENQYVTLYDMRYTDKQKFKFSAHESRALKCEWNPKIRNRLATSGPKNIMIWDLDDMNNHKLKHTTLLTTRNCAYSIKWSTHHENLLASHSYSSRYIEIWDINRRFKPYRHFKENPLNGETWSNQTKMVIHWHKDPHLLLTLNTNSTVVSVHARKDAINMDDFAPSGAITCSPNNKICFVTQRKLSRRAENVLKKLTKMTFMESAQDRIRKVGESVQPTQHVTTLSTTRDPPLNLDSPDMIKTTSDVSEISKALSCIFTYPLTPHDKSYSEKFKFLAKNYKCEDAAFEDVCQHNAVMAESQDMVHQAAAWRLLSVLFAAEEVVVPFYDDDIIMNVEQQKRNKRSDTFGDRTSMESHESGEQESDIENNDRYSDFEDEEYNRTIELPIEWDMNDEAFTHQSHLYNTESTECDDASDKSSVYDADVYDDDNVKDNVTSVRQTKAEMKINSFGPLTTEMLECLVNEGDVQTACTMVLVLGNKLARTLPDYQDFLDDRIVAWFYAYIDLLSRFRLWDVQAQLIASGPGRVKLLNGQSLITGRCANSGCNNSWLQDGVCAKCGPTAVCSVCRVTVKGLYVWCQGCCHGGHLDHLQTWFRTSKLCPSACGHECQFS